MTRIINQKVTLIRSNIWWCKNSLGLAKKR